MKDERNTISVIVPIYNVEPYLERCVKSITNQSYQNLEIILVDDGSPDSSGLMADEYALSDDRVIVIHKTNGGQAEARNFGMSAACGDYIGFVDSDDVIATDMYLTLKEAIDDTGADASECRKIDFYEGQEKPSFDTNGKTEIFEGEKIIEALLTDRIFTCTVWNMLVDSKIAKEILFEVGKINEDILWPYRVFTKCKSAVAISQRLYGYYQREGSTMNSTFTTKRFDALDALQTRALEIKENQPRLYPKAARIYAGACMNRYQFLCRQEKTEEYRRFKKELHKRFAESDRKAFMKTVNLKYRIWYTLFLSFPDVTCWIRNGLKIGL